MQVRTTYLADEVTTSSPIGHPNLHVFEQAGGQHLLFTPCFICHRKTDIDDVFQVSDTETCCFACFIRISNAYGDAAMESLRGEREEEYRAWLRELDPPSVNGTIRRRVFARDGHACRYCGRTDALTIDHVTPKSRGGAHHPDNLVTACASCNSRKHARTPEEAGMALRPLAGGQA